MQAVREALDASEERVVAALLAQEGVAQGVHGKSARSWSELAKGCPEAWRAMLRDRAAWAQLRHLLPLLVDQYARSLALADGRVSLRGRTRGCVGVRVQAGDGGAGQRGLAARPADHVGLGRQRGGTPAETTARPGPGGTRVNKPASLPLPWAGTNTSALGEQEQDTSTKLGYDFAVLPGLSSRFGVTGLPAQPF